MNVLNYNGPYSDGEEVLIQFPKDNPNVFPLVFDYYGNSSVEIIKRHAQTFKGRWK